MRSLSNDFTKYIMYFVFSFLAVGISSCSSDDDVDDIMEPEATGSVTVGDQTLSGNTLIIDNVTVAQDSWLVVRNEGEGTSTNMVADPVFIEAGSHNDVEVRLNQNANLTGNAEGDDFEVSLHVDNQNSGTRGTFDFDGMSGVDNPINDTAGQPVMQNVNTRAPSLNIDDNQMVTENNEVTFNSVNTARNGWVTLYGSNEDGTIDEDNIIGRRYTEAGEFTNFTVPFDDPNADYSGQTIFTRINNDDPADQQLTFTSGGTEDLPETFGFDPNTGEDRFVGNSAQTATPGAFTVGTGSGTGTGGGTTT